MARSLPLPLHPHSSNQRAHQPHSRTMGKHMTSAYADGAGTMSPLSRSQLTMESLHGGAHVTKSGAVHKLAASAAADLPVAAAPALAVTHAHFSLSPVQDKQMSDTAATAAQSQAAMPAQLQSARTPTGAATAAAVSAASGAPLTPSSLASTLGALAVPVSSAARQVLRMWVGAVSSGVTRALRLRSDWKEGQGARRKLAAVMRARAEERVAAKKREQMAMERLQQLEQQIHFMHQQLMNQSGAEMQSHSPMAAAAASPNAAAAYAVPTAPALTVPIAPPLTIAAVPQAPPMNATAAIAAPAAAASAAAATGNSAPASKPSAASLVAAAGQLRSVSAASASSKPAPRTAAGVTLDNLRQVKLKRVQPSTPVVRPHFPLQLSNSSFLMAALNARFQRTTGTAQPRRARVSMGATSLRSAAPIHLTTPMSTRTGIIYESAFSPMTPASEEQWTPAR